MSSQLENALRSQRDTWREISQRVSTFPSRDFPHDQPKRILIFGLGSSHFAAKLTCLALIRDKTRTRLPVIACSSHRIGTEVVPAKGDWAVAVSHRGKTELTLKALEACKRAGAFTILVSGKGAPCPESADYHLQTCALETIEPHTVSVTAAICAITTLFLGAKAVEEWDALTSIGDPDLDLMRRRAGNGPKAIIGEWEGEWLAKEGALKLMEIAKLPTPAFGSEEFHHGPHHAFGSEDPIWHISVPKDPRNAEIKAAYTIGVFGATPLAWMPALVELQWLAYAVAVNRGVAVP